jgi:acyl-CoA thioester hydrolase
LNDAEPAGTTSLLPGSFHYRRRVQFAETDMAGIVHFSSYLRYMEEAEHAMFRAAGLSVAHGELHWPRVSASCEYKHPLRFEDEIDIAVRASVGRRRMQYAFEVFRGERRVASGVMATVCARIDAAGAVRTIDVPAEVLDRLRSVLR